MFFEKDPSINNTIENIGRMSFTPDEHTFFHKILLLFRSIEYREYENEGKIKKCILREERDCFIKINTKQGDINIFMNNQGFIHKNAQVIILSNIDNQQDIDILQSFLSEIQ